MAGYDEDRDRLSNAKQAGKYEKSTREPHFLQIDRRMKETQNEIEYMTKMLESKKVYLKQLETVRRMVKPADEAKIQALISVGLL
jgi:hypothetical protein